MKTSTTSQPRKRQEELGQFLTATPVADFMASMFEPRRSTNRSNLIEADLVDCMVALPGQIFYSTQSIEALAA